MHQSSSWENPHATSRQDRGGDRRASGIGKAIALALAAEGADVAILDMDETKAQQVVAEINKQGRRPASCRCDVGFADQVEPAFGEAIAFLGKLDILVNNAGVIRFSQDRRHAGRGLGLHPPHEPEERLPLLPAGRPADDPAKQGGRIIAISSIHAVLSEPNCGHYTATKGGIESFCRTLATELAPHKITVNYIRPGATYTELTTPMYTPAVKRALYERVPLKEIAEAPGSRRGPCFWRATSRGT